MNPVIDLLGFLAAGATLCAFAQKRMLPMRISALAANAFFIAYGGLGVFYPVLVLHLLLLPLNLARLIQQIQDEAARAPTLLEEWRERAMAQAGRASPYPT